MSTMPSDLALAPHALHAPTCRIPSDSGSSGSANLADASDGPLGSAPHLAAGMAAQRAKQAIKARLFPERLELAPHIGRFTVLRELGRGGMGVVYVAYDEALDRRVAIKLLYEISGDDTDGQARLLREAQAMARLNHPNIAAVYEVGTHEGRVFIAMEFVQGQPLDVWLRDAQRSWSEVVEVFIQAGRGLHAAHCAGLVHRDFKPANVMLGIDGRVRVLDFGLARGTHMLEPDAVLGSLSTSSVTMPALAATLASPRKLGSALTREGTIVGTPAYMPPEQFRGEPLDARADQYALCVSLYEGLHGRLPFTGVTLAELWSRVLSGPPRTPPRGTRVPTWLHRVLLQGLATDPSQRFASMAALLAALERQPRRRLRAGLLAALAASTLAGAVYGADRYRNAPCDFKDGLIGLWDADKKAEMRQLFEYDGSSRAMTAWAKAENLLDEHADKWVEDQQTACRSLPRSHYHSDLHQRRQQCFSKSRLTLSATVNALFWLEEMDEEHVAQAARPLLELPDCLSENQLWLDFDPPRQETKTRVSQLYTELSRIETESQNGATEALLEASRELAKSARRANYLPLIADVLRQLSWLEWHSGLHTEGCSTVRDSYAVAEAARKDAVAAMDARDIIFMCDLEADERLFWAQLALDKTRLNNFPVPEKFTLRAEILARLSLAMLDVGRGTEGEALLLEAMELEKNYPGLLHETLIHAVGRYLTARPADHDRVKLRNAFLATLARLQTDEPKAVVYARLAERDYMGRWNSGDWSEARSVATTVIGIIREKIISDSEAVAPWFAKLAVASVRMESCHDAMGYVDNAVREMKPDPESSDLDRLSTLYGIALTYSACGARGEVLPVMSELKEAAQGADAPARAHWEAASALFHHRGLDSKSAVVMAERALSTSTEYVEPLSQASHIGFLEDHAEITFRAGLYPKAAHSAKEAIRLVEQWWGVSHIALAAPLTVLGRVELAAGNISVAVEHLERALALREKSDPQFRGETAFVLAQTLKKLPGEGRRARELGEQALREYEAAGPRRTAEHTEVKAWLAAL